MIVAVIVENNTRRADLPEGTTYRVTQDNGDTMEVEVSAWPEGYVREISKLQGKAELLNRELLENVEAQVLAQGGVNALAWTEATVWRRDSEIVQSLAQSLSIDLDEFFTSANEIEL